MPGKKERQRKLARERHERRLAREEQRRHAVRRTTQWVSAGVVLLLVVGVVVFTLVNVGGKKSSALPKSSGTPSASATSPASTPSPTPSPSIAEPATHCTYIKSGVAARNVGMPPAAPDYKATYQATIKTNRGDIVINLLNSKATCTVNSFVFLASKNFYTNTPCHRLTTSGSGIYVLQCGDPTGTGSGGPGYGFGDENLAGATYPAGTIAMAHSSLPNSNGSQFFLVYKNTSLPPQFTPFGTITSGLGVIQAVANGGSDNTGGPGDGHPKLKVTIQSVTIKKT